tara:strand:+ start:5938 stop:6744 length:807 start_codon:yes stop_codon:yes gene_type:complete
MGMLINLTLLILGTTGALAAFGGDTWRREPLPLAKRITLRGWLALACMIATLLVGISKEIRSNDLAAQAALKEQKLQEDLAASQTALEKVSENLEATKDALESTRAKLAAVEPSILEGIIVATSGIRRESDYSTPSLRGQSSLQLISGRNSPDSLRLYGGDYLEYHVFCSNNGRRESGFPSDDSAASRERPNSLAIRIGETYYPLGSEGRHMVIGPVGVPMFATLLNPRGLQDCSVKILIESADRTRVAQQLSPLIEAIRTAREDHPR